MKLRKLSILMHRAEQPNNKLVFSEGVRITKDLIDNVWNNEDEVVVDHMVDITFAVSSSASSGTILSYASL